MAKPDPVNSMTGFARADGGAEGYRWIWEVKSVNARNLDLRFRLPPGSDALEANIRAQAPKHFTRGNISVHLTLQRPDRSPQVRVNRAALDRVLELAEEVKRQIDAPPVSVDGLLALPGVLEPEPEAAEDEDVRAARDTALAETLAEAFKRLAEARAEEGRRLAIVMEERLAEIEAHCAAAEAIAATQPEASRKRLQEQLDALLGPDKPVPDDRLAQEVALIAARGDVREELDRLQAHIASARELVAAGGTMGRRLDFLCQEFNREANTLCSKSSDLELTRIGLDLKAAIERLREQVQNVE